MAEITYPIETVERMLREHGEKARTDACSHCFDGEPVYKSDTGHRWHEKTQTSDNIRYTGWCFATPIWRKMDSKK
jgi:hypothetical protein